MGAFAKDRRTRLASRYRVVVGAFDDDETGSPGAVSAVIAPCVQCTKLVGRANVAPREEPHFLRRQDQRRGGRG